MESVCSLEEGGREADRDEGHPEEAEAEEPQAPAVHVSPPQSRGISSGLMLEPPAARVNRERGSRQAVPKLPQASGRSALSLGR